MRSRLLVLFVEDVDVPLGIRLGAVAEGYIEAKVIVLANRADLVVLRFRDLDLLEIRFDAVC